MLPDNSLIKQEQLESDITHYRKQGASMMLTVPKSLREVLNWKEGDMLFVTAHRNTLVIVPARSELFRRMREYVEEADRIN